MTILDKNEIAFILMNVIQLKILKPMNKGLILIRELATFYLKELNIQKTSDINEVIWKLKLPSKLFPYISLHIHHMILHNEPYYEWHDNEHLFLLSISTNNDFINKKCVNTFSRITYRKQVLRRFIKNYFPVIC